MYGQTTSAGWRSTARHEEGFNDLLYSQLRRTPWWFVSIAFHGLVVLILFSTPFATGSVGADTKLRSRVEEEVLLPPEQEVKPEVEEVVPPEQDPTDEVEYTDEPIPSDEDAVDDENVDEPLVDDDFIGKSPFEGPATNDAIGIGGGAGGFGQRGRGRKKLRAIGDGRASQRVVDLGLEWLKNHQDPDGMWDCDGFMGQCKLNQCDGPGHALYDPGVSGLALLAFLGTGQTHRHGRYKKTVKKAIKYLKGIQDPEGCFGPRTEGHFTYNHAIGALAMAEAYGLTGSPLFKQSAQLAIDFVHKSQNPYLAWRYGVRPGENDTSVTGWMVMALKSAKMAKLRVDQATFDGVSAWLDKVTEPEYGRVGYTTRGDGPARTESALSDFPPEKSESLTAVGLLSRIFIGENPKKSEAIQKGVDLVARCLPVWDEGAGSIDMYYWYYGTLALYQVGGDPWKRWSGAIEDAIVSTQRKSGDEKGSWDPVGAWGREGGRVYSTAVCVMCMEVWYRYPKIFTGG
ncbi:MAG: prenyltransferase/squalene oxidase repeat-containing protein [Planctomycetota bacterium]|jgi:hypothetical protein